MTAPNQTRIDLRTVAPRSRLAVVGYTSQLLRAGQSMEITDDHDPVDVFDDFQGASQRFAWQTLERGPQLWRVRVTRALAPVAPLPARAATDDAPEDALA